MPPAGFSFSGLLDASGTLAISSVAEQTSALTLTTSAGTQSLTLTASTSSIVFPNGEVWSASGFAPSARFQYTTVRKALGTTPSYSEPWFRWNLFGNMLVGDVTNGVVSTTSSQATITWENGDANWTVTLLSGALPYYTGTFANNQLQFSDGTWTLTTLEPVVSRRCIAKRQVCAARFAFAPRCS